MIDKEQAKNLKATAKTWSHICRGFKLDPNGTKTIRLHGQGHVGEWVYGYYIPADDSSPLIYGGTEIDDILGGKKQIEVLKDSICKCTGLAVEKGDSVGKMLFEYDVVNAGTCIEGIVSKRFFNFENAFVYWHAPTLSWGIMDDRDGKGYPFNHEWSFEIKGTVFDVDQNFSKND